MNKKLYYIPCGRSLGEFDMNNKYKTFIVANGFTQHELTQFEHVVWKQVKSFDSLEKWETAILKKIANVSQLNFSQVIDKLVDNHLIHPWSFASLEDPLLAALHVTRNGYAHGNTNGKWVISSTDTKKSYELTKDQFDIWNCAAGQVMLLEVIENVMNQRQLTEEDAFQLVTRYAAQLISLGLWNVEYVVDQGMGE